MQENGRTDRPSFAGCCRWGHQTASGEAIITLPQPRRNASCTASLVTLLRDGRGDSPRSDGNQFTIYSRGSRRAIGTKNLSQLSVPRTHIHTVRMYIHVQYNTPQYIIRHTVHRGVSKLSARMASFLVGELLLTLHYVSPWMSQIGRSDLCHGMAPHL